MLKLGNRIRNLGKGISHQVSIFVRRWMGVSIGLILLSCIPLVSAAALEEITQARLAAMGDRARFISQDVPTNLFPGQTVEVAITFKNNGTTNWTRAGGYKLGTQNPENNTLWAGVRRIRLTASEAIAPGQSKTFTFRITAPAEPGTYDFQWRMVQGVDQWFGKSSANLRIKVQGAKDKARFVSQSVPTMLSPGETTKVSITFKNNGTSTWTRAGGYKLGTQNPENNTLWTGARRIRLTAPEAIQPGQSRTFTFDITAPNQPGTYDFQWRMVQGVDQWFGKKTPNVHIQVGSSMPTATPPPIPTPLPEPDPVDFQIRPGLWAASAKESSAQDLDGDGLAQITELELAQWFFPTIWFDNGEDCTEPGGAGQYPPDQPGRLVFRVRRHPNHSDRIAITYALLFQRDCGDFGGIGDHPGDVEAFGITLAPDASCPLGYGIISIATWAHEGTFGEVDEVKHFSHRCEFGFSVGPTGRSDIVLSSENKHGNYLSDSTCDGAILSSENCDLDYTLGDVNAWVGFNAGEAHHPLQDNLAPLGFPGERIWTSDHFCGGLSGSGCPGSVYSKLRLASPSQGAQADAIFVSQSVPTQLDPGEKAVVSITYRNNGGTVWRDSAGYRLGTQNPPDNVLWTGSPRQLLSPTDSILQGQEKTFTFTITAPQSPGSYNFQWRMVQEAVQWFGEPTPNIAITVGSGRTDPQPTPETPLTWEDDDFNSLTLGRLKGQNGWAAYSASARVTERGGGDQMLRIDPASGKMISMGKEFPDLTGGRNVFEFDVMVTGATSPSLAKIEMNTSTNAGWNKKFQIYFGSSIRLNYGPRGEAVNLIPSVVDGRWYHLRMEMDLGDNTVDVWVDQYPAAIDVPMHTGSITEITLSGWDRAGSVFLDNVLGSQ